jgi:hypothetical protein
MNTNININCLLNCEVSYEVENVIYHKRNKKAFIDPISLAKVTFHLLVKFNAFKEAKNEIPHLLNHK